MPALTAGGAFLAAAFPVVAGGALAFVTAPMESSIAW